MESNRPTRFSQDVANPDVEQYGPKSQVSINGIFANWESETQLTLG